MSRVLCPRLVGAASLTAVGILFAPAAALLAAGRPAAPGNDAPGRGQPPSAASPALARSASQRGYQVIARNCLKCHGEGSRLSGLDLRTRETALKGGEHGAVLQSGNPAASRLLPDGRRPGEALDAADRTPA